MISDKADCCTGQIIGRPLGQCADQINSGKSFLVLKDIMEHPVWLFDRDLELCFPVHSLDMKFDGIDSLQFRTEFVSAKGDKLIGTISGQGEVIVSIYNDKSDYLGDKRWPELTAEQFKRLINDMPELRARTVVELLPLRWTTRIDQKPFNEWSGVFDVPELRGELGLGDAAFPTRQSLIDDGHIIIGQTGSDED